MLGSDCPLSKNSERGIFEMRERKKKKESFNLMRRIICGIV